MKQGIYLRPLAQDADEAVIDVVGVIGWEVWYQQMRDMLRSIPAQVKRVVFDIYSPGGDVWEGNGIIQEIGELGKRAETVARVQMAASMATLIAVACQKRSIARNGRFLIHNAWAGVTGDAAELEKMAATLRDCENEAIKFYAERTGGGEDDIRALMNEERWMMPEETQSRGFVHEIVDPFEPSEYAKVRQEIEAAGKWPQALAELPAQSAEEVGTDVVETDTGTGTVAPVVETAAPAPDDDANAVAADALSAAEAAGYERGRLDGESAATLQVRCEWDTEKHDLTKRLDAANRHVAQLQSERDKLTAQLAAAVAAGDARAASLREQLDRAGERLRAYTSGALTWESGVETWEQAMVKCGGDYAKAAKQYPQLRDQYIAAQRQKEQGR